MAASVPVVAAASIDQRFAQLIQQFGLTKNSFAISLGKTASVVQHLIDGRNKPGFDLMCKVFEVYPNVSRDWLLLGRGPMLVGSNGLSGPAVAAAQPAAAEPDFEPIDLADVAPRAARRPTVSRLQPEEIAATLALATAAEHGISAVAPVISSASAPVFAEPQAAENHAVPPAQVAPIAAAPAAMPPVVAAHRPVRPFRPAPAPNSPMMPEPAVPLAAPVAPAASVPPIPTGQQPASPAAPAVAAAVEPPLSPAVLAPAPGGADAYVAAAIHAQHLQHQLALAELRNQHLLEQQQMLREMLAMARQSMV
ncbi:helix-turn-helix domain-containing protein [Hymenobacter sp. DH14]|uniref:Helix-turn-helix domain-containing protein n=1 Tax=Hymenobacter cyanobacteriorum TaxID=2926463 RepID=A0A9X2AI83_9BACT|nr:helix-turn-helix domain-containing protein [Hymenobacter cyanobacteriorum]MCI1187434.1 helix-turn-helix domain-containing protein [Hymenobacter cyanobacteriorum]